MTRDLATLKDVLWEQFEEAVKRQGGHDQYDGGKAAMNRQALGTLASAIVAVEAEQRAADKPAVKLKKSATP